MIRTSLLAAAFLALSLAAAAAPSPRDDARPDPSRFRKVGPGVARSTRTAYRTDTVELQLSGAGEGSEVEYSVHARMGDTLVYSWRAEGLPRGGEFYAEFHGSTVTGSPVRELSYREGLGGAGAGALAAPFDGVHGWLFKNNSGKPVKVRLTIAGFYAPTSLRESMGLEGPEYVPFGPPGWPDRFAPAQKK